MSLARMEAENGFGLDGVELGALFENEVTFLGGQVSTTPRDPQMLEQILVYFACAKSFLKLLDSARSLRYPGLSSRCLCVSV